MSGFAQQIPSMAELDRELAERSLAEYSKQAWVIVEPATELLWNWHHDAVCEHLEAVTRGEIKNLIINMPPRHTKSLLTSVFWPTQSWTTRPHLRWLFGSHDLRLAVRDSLKCRRIVRSAWYKNFWGMKLVPDQDMKAYFENSATGYRMATSVDSGITGEGGDIIVCDDPHNVLDAMWSKTSRERAIFWWSKAMSTRLNPGSELGAKVVIMQRVHEYDLTGFLLDTDPSYVHLCLPAEYEPKYHCSTRLGWQDPRSEEGRLLWDPPFGKAEVDSLKVQLGSYSAAGQLQQRPAPEEGGMLNKTWWKHIPREDYPKQFDAIIQCWDLAFGDSENSYTVGFALGIHGANVYGLGRVRGRLEFPGQLASIRALTAAYPDAAAKYVEKAANAKALNATLEDEIPGIILVQPQGSKVHRAQAWAPYLEAGNCYLPEGEEWAEELVYECQMFPNGRFADQVDAFGLGTTKLMQNIHAPAEISVGDALERPSEWSV